MGSDELYSPSFSPIAIIGQSCVYPGALDINAFWKNIINKVDVTTNISEEQLGISYETFQKILGDDKIDWRPSLRGGLVSGFDQIFDPEGFLIPAEEILKFDPMVHWILHAGKQALLDAGYSQLSCSHHERTGAILGILAYPTESMSRFCESVLLEKQNNLLRDIEESFIIHKRPDAINYFCSGLPSQILCRALGLGGNRFSLDTACASSLYVIKFACDELQQGRADLMLAGAVNGADKLIARIFLSKLGAVSPTGFNRPFDKRADGIVLSEGTGFVVLKRLDDAWRDQDHILGVIRGIGFSNDGRGKGLMAPASEGQIRAMEMAYKISGLQPKQIGLIECHATGTSIGDKTEMKSMTSVWSSSQPKSIGIGSLKSNMGHLLIPTGMASLQKILKSIDSKIMPPTIYCDEPLEELEEPESIFYPVQEPLPWKETEEPRRAAINSFGFGGCNAHLIIEEWKQKKTYISTPRYEWQDIAIVGIGISGGKGNNLNDFINTLFSEYQRQSPSDSKTAAIKEDIKLSLNGLRFPPNDLSESLPQQALMLEVARDALRDYGKKDFSRERSGVIIGAQSDHEISTYLARWHLQSGNPQDKSHSNLSVSNAVGTVPNFLANRINSQFDLGGLGLIVSAEELSGIIALQIAINSLQSHEMNIMVIGAVDLSCDPRYQSAIQEVGSDPNQFPGDGAIAMVLKRLKDAECNGDRIYAVINDIAEEKSIVKSSCLNLCNNRISNVLGHVHAASGLLTVIAASLACYHRALPPSDSLCVRPWLIDDQERSAVVSVSSLGERKAYVQLSEGPRNTATKLAIPLPIPKPALFIFHGKDRSQLVSHLHKFKADYDKRLEVGLIDAALNLNNPQEKEMHRLAIVVRDMQDLKQKLALSSQILQSDEIPANVDGVFYSDKLIEGDMAFVFTGGAASYSGMGQDLLAACPDILESLGKQTDNLAEFSQQAWIYPMEYNENLEREYSSTPLRQMWATSFLSQAHAEFTRHILGLKPQAIIGYSSGEANGFYCMGIWRDVDEIYRTSFRTSLFTDDLAGNFNAVRKAWRQWGFEREASQSGSIWASWTLPISPDRALEALEEEPLVHLSMINNLQQCVISGEINGCRRVIDKLNVPAYSLKYANVNHCPEVGFIAQDYVKLHTWKTYPGEGIRFYTNATGTYYIPTEENAARMMYEQARKTLDFPRLIQNAYDDGVRIFLEHGPRNFCSRHISAILGQRPHRAISLDIKGQDSLWQVLRATAQLCVAGVDIDWETLFKSLYGKIEEGLNASASIKEGTLCVPAHWPLPVMPKMDRSISRQEGETFREMSAAPSLPSIRERSQESVHVYPIDKPPNERKLGRKDLGVLASGKVSAVFGPMFKKQDNYIRQVRPPEPPLLLIDRVLCLEGEAGSLGKGRIITETDVTIDSWYLHDGAMPMGLMTESTQGDLILASWLGADFYNKDRYVYRLLQGDVTFYGDLPRPTSTLRFDIHSDGFVSIGGSNYFSFYADCYIDEELRLSVRNCRAGFFTDEQLVGSTGIIWKRGGNEINQNHIARPHQACLKSSFSGEEIQAFCEGRLFDCFGIGFEEGKNHRRSPRIPGGNLRLIDHITVFDTVGGPWRCGYLCAEKKISQDDWYFRGHFKNDPCMPGNLMFEGCVQATEFFMAAVGMTITRDRWRFKPISHATIQLKFGKQAIPTSKVLRYEVFVRKIIYNHCPVIVADVLVSVDNIPACHCKNLSLELVPEEETKDVCVDLSRTQLACHSDGKLQDAFDQRFEAIDGYPNRIRIPRGSLLLCDRVTRVDTKPLRMEIGSLTSETLLHDSCWYLHCGRIPPGILCEASQAIFVLMSWIGIDNLLKGIKRFRLLDVDFTYFHELPKKGDRLIFDVNLQEITTFADVCLVSYVSTCKVLGEKRLIAHCKAGFFLEEELRKTRGITMVRSDLIKMTKGELRPKVNCKRDVFKRNHLVALTLGDLTACFGSEYITADKHRCTPRICGGKLLLIDRIVSIGLPEGCDQPGYLKAEMDVFSDFWLFAAHFKGDPVFPGTLISEASFQLLSFYLIYLGYTLDWDGFHFEPLVNESIHIECRGQMTPSSKMITYEVLIDEIGYGPIPYVRGDVMVSVDGLKVIYIRNIGVRLVAD